MKKHLFFTGVYTLIVISLCAQEYKMAAGIRLGPNAPAIAPGFTAKYFLDEHNGLEAILSVGNGFGLCGLYEWHQPIASVAHLQWFAGGGAYLATRERKTFVGAAGIVGLDYKFEDIPLNISIDWKPELNLFSSVGYEGTGVGISARFVF